MDRLIRLLGSCSVVITPHENKTGELIWSKMSAKAVKLLRIHTHLHKCEHSLIQLPNKVWTAQQVLVVQF